MVFLKSGIPCLAADICTQRYNDVKYKIERSTNISGRGIPSLGSATRNYGGQGTAPAKGTVLKLVGVGYRSLEGGGLKADIPFDK